MIEDYANFSFTLSKKPTKKEWLQLSKKLNTYVNSSKFIREGSTVDLYDLDTGKRIKRPIYNVLYKKNLEDLSGIPAQTLKRLIQNAIYNKDRDAMKELLLYQFYSADRFVTSREQLLELRKKRRNKVLLQTAVLGGVGSLLGLVPYMKAKNEAKPITKLIIGLILKATGIGASTGVTASGLILLFR